MTDPVNHPAYYVLPNGVETKQVTQWLTSAGGQAVQYIVRATRIDGVVKGDPVEDLRKARTWLDTEIHRLTNHP